MIPLSHNNTPTELENYVKLKGQSLTIQDFSAHDFQGVKKIVRDRLHTLQGELCVYCEKNIALMKCKLNILNQNQEEMLNLISVSPTVIMLFHVFKKIVRLKLVDKKER